MEKDLGSIIKKKREIYGLKQKELAKLVDITPSEISKIEHGERKKPNTKLLLKLKNKLNITNEELANIYGKDFMVLFENDDSYSSKLDNVFSPIEVDKILSLNKFDLIKLKEYINLLYDNDNMEQKEAISILVKSLNKNK